MIPEIVDIARNNAKQSGGSFNVSHSMADAMKDADIVYPKSWAPYHIMQQRTKLLMGGEKAALKDLEQVCLANNAKYRDWEYTEQMRKVTKNADALYMHCLPADISGESCVQGEVSAETFERYRIKTYLEAGYKPYIIAAMMLTNRFQNPAKLMKDIYSKNSKRVLY